MTKSLRLRNIGSSRVTLRGLTHIDRAQHEAHLLRLSAADRRARFHAAISDAAIVGYSSGIDWDKALIFGIFVDETLRGMGELLSADASGGAEASLSVEEPFRRMNLGRLLVVAMVLAARNFGFQTIHLDYIANNHPMRALIQKLGAISAQTAGVVHVVKTIPPGANSLSTGSHA